MAAGNSLTHDSARDHVSGTAQYVDDIRASDGQLYVAIGGSGIAHGRVLSMDLSEVRASPGVVDVITADDLPGATDIGPVFPGDPLLAADVIEYVGQALFAVAAKSQLSARRAVLLATIKYEELTPILELEEALEKSFFVRPPHTMRRGDAEKALAEAPHRLHGAITIGGQEHFYLEGQVCLATPQEGGGVTLYSSNQNPTEAQHIVASVLAVPMHRVTVVTRRMGGGFGGKETQANACCALAALFAIRQQVSVNCRLSRGDDMRMTGKRHGFFNRYDVGFDEHGQILAVAYILAGQCGNSPDLSDAIVDRAMFHCDNAYYLPAVVIDGLRCKTHTVSNTAFRGFGGPQGMMAMEAVIDEIAIALGKDPLEIRRLNFYRDEERNLTPYHQKVTTFTVPQVVDQLAHSALYTERRAQVREFNSRNTILKMGIALTPVKFGISFTVSHLNQGGALLHLYHDGSVMLNHGGTEMGQGLMIKIVQIVASELGMKEARIAISATRTDKVPNTSPTAASSGTDINGMAALNAALTIKRRLIEYLIRQHGVTENAIEFANDCVTVKADTAIVYSWPELASVAYRNRVQLSATGFYKTPKIHYNRDTASGRPFLYFANGASVTEVIIDTLTGETRILRTDILHDVGRSINPAIDLGQIEGGFVQGLGWLTHEELKWDEKGQLLTDGPATYKIPAIGDMPDVFNVELLADSPNAEATIFHSKAVGEPPLMLAISAFAAIRDAIAATVGHKQFPPLNSPATPEEVLRVCQQLKSQHSLSVSVAKP